VNIQVSCPHCQHTVTTELKWPLSDLFCASCNQLVFPHLTDSLKNQKKLEQCPACGASHLYRRKDFNQRLGIFLIVLGISLAYFTYGISLLAVTLLDFFLFRRVQEVGICYSCEAQFRNSPLVEALEPFDLELFDYYKNLKERTLNTPDS